MTALSNIGMYLFCIYQAGRQFRSEGCSLDTIVGDDGYRRKRCHERNGP